MTTIFFQSEDPDLVIANRLIESELEKHGSARSAESDGGAAPSLPGIVLGPIASTRQIDQLRGILNAVLPVKVNEPDAAHHRSRRAFKSRPRDVCAHH